MISRGRVWLYTDSHVTNAGTDQDHRPGRGHAESGGSAVAYAARTPNCAPAGIRGSKTDPWLWFQRHWRRTKNRVAERASADVSRGPSTVVRQRRRLAHLQRKDVGTS